jgi:hypothetical protein
VKQVLGGNKFKGDRKVASLMAGWLIRAETDFRQRGTEKLVSLYDKFLGCGEY